MCSYVVAYGLRVNNQKLELLVHDAAFLD